MIDVNDGGIATGYADRATGGSGVVLWLPGAGAMPVPELSDVRGIGPNGTLAGMRADIPCQVVRWRAGWALVSAPQGQPTTSACLQGRAMSDNGWYVAGSFEAPPTNFIYDLTRPFSWYYGGLGYPPFGTVVDVGPTNGTWKYSLPRDVSDLGTLVGEVSYPPLRRQAAAWYPGTGLVLYGPPCPGPSGSCNGAAHGINKWLTIVGEQDGRPVRFRPGPVTVLGGLAAGLAVDVNDRDEILIQAGNAAYLLRGEVLVPLAALNGGCCVGVSKVNEHSQVAGWATDGATGRNRPVVWDVAGVPPSPFQVSAGGPYTGTEGERVYFSGSASGGTAPYTFIWSYGDGTSETTVNGSRVYGQDGVRTVSLTVVDYAGAAATASTTATIRNASPVVQVMSVSNLTIDPGGSVQVLARYGDAGAGDAPWTLELAARYEPQLPDTAHQFETTYGFGTSDRTPPSTISASITLHRPGIHAMSVILRDKDGGSAFGGIYSVRVRAAAPPVVTASGPATVAEGAPATLSATASGGTTPIAWRWSFGDGGEATTATATHRYMDDGSYTATVIGTAANGLADTATVTILVTNVAPTLMLGPGATVWSGDTFTVRGSVDDAGVRDAPWAWRVEWPTDGGTDAGSLDAVPGAFDVAATLRRAGVHVVVARVTDADGASTSATLAATVLRLPLRMVATPASAEAAGRGRGLLTVIVHSSDRVSVADVDVPTVRLGDVAVAPRGNGAPMADLEDLDGDGVAELVLKFRRDALAAAGVLEAPLRLLADLRDGRQVSGSIAPVATRAR